MNAEHFGLDRIRELTATVEIPEGVLLTPSVKQYPTPDGILLVWNIHWQEEFAINQIFMSEDTKLEGHTRGEKEWVVVVSGKLLVTVKGKQIILLPSQQIIFEAGVPRDVISECDTYILSVTMPASLDWPR